ncbi:amino acid/amide ABC transporter ATP-binding protein 1, HAAT family [Lacrimispora sphenoides]|jgi:branched-chain amino acid transport system ATP-binding protein|uniref:ABC transporter ATP-binding protein n=1 Tax=Lacrimispora sphenoides TaxID=29370 RepID=UPI0008CA1EDB|nr:ABC transporter ATP-binding protein [Lacrimispora sphenoides]SEU32679.1 amino acid/amide ABC transporter ATP-binding protein 1, HAAT family [Lacrimispora sphenoides]
MLTVKDVTLRFGGLTAVNNVSLTIKQGTINGLIGPNGAGKTTFFNLISGVYTPNEGEIVFDGVKLNGKKCFEINHIGMSRTYQVINLFRKMTVVENVMVGLHPKMKSGYFSAILGTKGQREEEKEVLEKALDWLDFVGLRVNAYEMSGSLSYGKQRLLEIVRALASNPKLLLLDEPAAGMNSKEKEELFDILRKIQNLGVTILMIEHDMKLMMGITDYIFVLNYGKKLAEGTPVQIQNNPEVIAAYLGED